MRLVDSRSIGVDVRLLEDRPITSDFFVIPDKTEIVPIVCSMEHLIWHFGRLLNFPFTEEKIEIGFNSARFHNLYRLRYTDTVDDFFASTAVMQLKCQFS